MTFYILLLVCINGASGCTYDNGPSLRLLYQGSYSRSESCEKDAAAITARYADPGLYGRCIEVRSPSSSGEEADAKRE